MKQIVLLASLLLLSFISTALPVQTPPDHGEMWSITGKIFDETGKPIELATVILKNMRDTVVIKGVATGKDGAFLFKDLQKSTYVLDISCLGYKKLSLPNLVISDDQKAIALKPQQLEPLAVETQAMLVTGERAAEEFKADMKVINVSQTLNAAGGTALDVLQNQPSVRVDADGTVTLRGSTNFTVQVNGRPSILQGADALRQIPANMIDNIELITNPSAKHESEGSAGIINIVLKKQTENNFNGIVNTSAGSRDKYNSDAAINYKQGTVNASGSFEYRNMSNFNTQELNRESSTSSGTQYNTSNLNIRMRRENYSGRVNVEKTFSEKHSLALGGSAGRIGVNFNVNTVQQNRVESNNPVFGRNDQKTEMNADFYNSTLFYTRSLNPNNDDLTFDGSVTRVILPLLEKATQFATDAYYNPADNAPSMRTVNNSTNRWESRLKANFKHSFGEKSVLEVGVQSNLFFKDIDYGYKSFDHALGIWVNNPNLSNVYTFNNNVHAGFVTYSDELAGFGFQLGLRSEYTDRRLKQTSMGNEFAYRKNHFFPSASLSKKISADQQLQFSYSRRINRPFDQQLNPFATYADNYTTSRGNPYLLPEFTHSIELNYQKYFAAGFLSAQTYTRHTTDGITQTLRSLNGKLEISAANANTVTTAGADISGSVPVAAWWKFDPSVNMYNNHVVSKLDGREDDRQMFTWNLRVNNSFTISPSTKLQVTGMYNAKDIGLQGEVGSFLFWTLALRQEFLEKSLIVNLQAQNLLNPMRIDINSAGNNFVSNIVVKNEAPVFTLSMSYNFNSYKRSQRMNDGVDVNIGTGL